jgi:hypothetical protein
MPSGQVEVVVVVPSDDSVVNANEAYPAEHFGRVPLSEPIRRSISNGLRFGTGAAAMR